jgi:hypothetical protein
VKRVNSNPPPPKGPKPAPPRNPPPVGEASTRLRYSRIGDVLTDVRDRLTANGHAASLAGIDELGTLARRIESLGRDAQAAGNEPHPIDWSVASDFRETMLEVACLAACAVLEHDRRWLKANRAGGAT